MFTILVLAWRIVAQADVYNVFPERVLKCSQNFTERSPPSGAVKNQIVKA